MCLDFPLHNHNLYFSMMIVVGKNIFLLWVGYICWSFQKANIRCPFVKISLSEATSSRIDALFDLGTFWFVSVLVYVFVTVFLYVFVFVYVFEKIAISDVFAPCRPHGKNTLSTCCVWTTPTPRGDQSLPRNRKKQFSVKINRGKNLPSIKNKCCWLLTFCFSKLMFIKFCDSFSWKKFFFFKMSNMYFSLPAWSAGWIHYIDGEVPGSPENEHDTWYHDIDTRSTKTSVFVFDYKSVCVLDYMCLSLYPTSHLEKASHSGLGVGPHPAPLLLQFVTPLKTQFSLCLDFYPAPFVCHK